MKEFGLTRDGVFVAGLSTGGAMAAILDDLCPAVFSAVGVHSGLARGAARDVLSAISAMHSGNTPQSITPGFNLPSDPLRRIIFQGDADGTVYPSNVAVIVAVALTVQASPTKVTRRSVLVRSYCRSEFAGTDGEVLLELWMLEGTGHAWSGGR